MKFSESYPVWVRADCPLDTIYFLPKGSTTRDLSTGETLELAPGYYVNPKQLGKITNVATGNDPPRVSVDEL